MSVTYAVPSVELVRAGSIDVDDEWAIAGVVAAYLGIAVGVVAYICSVCNARSFWSCVSAVRAYFSRGGC